MFFCVCLYVTTFSPPPTNTQKKGKRRLEKPLPPHPLKKTVHFRVSNAFSFFCVCVRMRTDECTNFFYILSLWSACARACPARRPQKKARRGREEEEEEVGCFFSKRRRIIREVLPVERRRRRPKFIRWSAGLVVIIIG